METTARAPNLQPLRDDTGSASVLALGVLALVAGLAVAVAAAGSSLVERHRVGAAADAAALAAADAASGLVTGDPCASAEAVAGAVGLGTTACRIEGTTATVRVSSHRGPLPVEAVATAGQPPDAASERTADVKK